MTEELHRSMRRALYHPDGSGPRLEVTYNSDGSEVDPEVTVSDGCRTLWLRPEDIDTLRDWLYDARIEHRDYLDDCAKAEGAGAPD